MGESVGAAAAKFVERASNMVHWGEETAFIGTRNAE
jgi:hypothetical protein